MKISEYYRQNQLTFSFEFFPPKTPEGEDKLFEAVAELRDLNPSFVSVTYGAMGTTSNNTVKLVGKIQAEIGIVGAAHLTCIAHSKAEIETVLHELQTNKIENIVALRGDYPQNGAPLPEFRAFKYASELVKFIRQHARFSNSFSLAVAGYPEGHIECPDKEKDLDHLKLKVDAGADVIITQLFFRNADYFRFVEKCRKKGIHIPIVPGIMPVTNGTQIQKFTKMCGAHLPTEFHSIIEKYHEKQEDIESFGIEYATKQCHELLQAGIPGIHFYTLNKSAATRKIYSNLGLRP